ncbi:unnamed protein product [Nippostrongylus brasiliensis]|uniref:Transmembrane protein n=1 Tax=Nippostrongylus brasiliensis TaxID=27835 RepID=A0A0N4Y909_NIPBR|nr:unnamed protein product [Nippostrongylus brasiliensis]
MISLQFMLLSPVYWAARKREDRRPLYRRILTNRRLDILHKTFIRSILGFILFSTSYCVVNTGIYYKFVRPLRQEERELLERELIEADRAGFSVMLSNVLTSLAARWEGLFLIGFTAGSGVNYYSVFKKKQLQKELDEFERTLKDLDDLITQGVPRTL